MSEAKSQPEAKTLDARGHILHKVRYKEVKEAKEGWFYLFALPQSVFN